SGLFKIIKPNGLLERNGSDIGCASNPNVWGGGLMTAALRNVSAWARTRATSLLQARASADTLASCKVLQPWRCQSQSQSEGFDVFLPNKKISELYYVKILTREIERSENNAVDERF